MASTATTDAQAAASLADAEKVEVIVAEQETPQDFVSRFMRWMNGRGEKQRKSFDPIPRFDDERLQSVLSGETVLYLAYGSNLCASTFQGSRDIRPISALNVIVPDLDLTFDLDGIPYSEPCFANSSFKKIEAIPQELFKKGASAEENAALANALVARNSNRTASALGWTKGLVGVAYEITLEDYQHVMATEGGGTSYSDIVVPCFPLDQDEDEVSPNSRETALKAHTLFSSGDARFRRTGKNQPSKRYLDLIRSGAREHKLPNDYQDWLASLQPYTITTRRQDIGKILFRLVWMPWLIIFFVFMRSASGPKGSRSKAARFLSGRLFSGVWLSYDWGFKWIWGNGESTEVK